MKLLLPLLFFFTSTLPALTQSNFWEPVNGPQGIIAVDLYHGSDSVLYAKDYDYRYFRSINNGAYWTEIMTPISGSFSEGFHVGQTGALFCWDANFTQLFRSTDRGETWNPLPFTIWSSFAEGSDSALYVASYDAVLKTFDGVVWDTLYLQQNLGFNNEFVRLAFLPDGALVVAQSVDCDQNDKFFLISNDLGITWDTMPGAGDPKLIAPLGNDEYLYFVNNGPWCYSWFKTAHFYSTPVPVTPPGHPIEGASSFVGMPNGTILRSTFDSNYISLDAGQSWQTHDGSVLYAEFPYPLPATGELMRSWLGVRKSSDLGKTWRYSGYSSQQCPAYDLTFQAPNLIYALSYTGFWRSENDGAQWELSNMDNYMTYDNYFSNGNLSLAPDGSIYLYRQNNQLLQSTDQGLNFEKLPFPVYEGSCDQVAVHPVTGEIFVSNEWYLLASSDNGIFWEIRNTDESFCTSGIKFHPNGNLYAILDNKVKYSTNGGFTWETVLDQAPPWNIRLLEIANNGKLVASNEYECYFSSDNGATWTSSSIQDGIWHLAINSDGDVYVASFADLKIYHTKNDGLSWVALPPVATNLAVNFIQDIAFDQQDRLWVSAEIIGLMRTTKSTLDALEPAQREMSLKVYPNPTDEGFWV
ncbi:MAG: hypothetical protein JNJ57_03845, partial [Saprospiraceae bacterium]|nr:hypothetical protein [Saprospiraceae bacterium]